MSRKLTTEVFAADGLEPVRDMVNDLLDTLAPKDVKDVQYCGPMGTRTFWAWVTYEVEA